MEKETGTYAWLRLALYSPLQKYQEKKKQRRFWARPTLSKRKLYDGYELLVDL
jgi:hypothetical protein